MQNSYCVHMKVGRYKYTIGLIIAFQNFKKFSRAYIYPYKAVQTYIFFKK